MRGSMSDDVVQDLLVLLRERLPVLARAHGSIRGVRLTGSPEAYKLEPESD